MGYEISLFDSVAAGQSRGLRAMSFGPGCSVIFRYKHLHVCLYTKLTNMRLSSPFFVSLILVRCNRVRGRVFGLWGLVGRAEARSRPDDARPGEKKRP